MDSKKIMGILTEIFKDIFDDESLILNISMQIQDIDGCDSLNFITLMDAIEDEFNIRFLASEFYSLKNIGQLIEAIEKKLN